ncbi:hypothetical protein T484DRAFT_1827938 [Baffinella frigidus]|nr:hypothetical protein T484DRAFT_1827938 [Cryptophyta sp. CCMP2293]
MGGIAIWDDATATIAISTFFNGKLDSYGIRVATSTFSNGKLGSYGIRVATSTFSNGKLGSYGIRVADAANVTLKDLLFERLYTAVAVHVDIDDDSNPFATLRILAPPQKSMPTPRAVD